MSILIEYPPYFQETPAFAEIGTNLDLKKNQPSISEKVFSDSEYIIFLYPTWSKTLWQFGQGLAIDTLLLLSILMFTNV